MSYEQEFLQDFEAWVKTQVMINEMALKESQAVYEADQDERAKDFTICQTDFWVREIIDFSLER